MNLIGLLKSKTREKILKLFFSDVEKKYYLRELEKKLSIPVGNIRRELISLEELGVFKKEKVGNLVYYFLNKSSPFFGVFENIILITKKEKKNKQNESKELIVVKKNDLELLFVKISELENILESFSQKNLEVEDFLNLGIVINSKKEVLLVRRVEKEKGKNGSVLSWAFPGGKQRITESRAECVAREVLDETGYKIETLKEISSRIHPQFPVFVVYHLCRLLSEKQMAKPRESHEIAEIRWVKPKEIKKMFTSNLDPNVGHELGLN